MIATAGTRRGRGKPALAGGVSADQWAAIITKEVGAAVRQIIEVGACLFQAKLELPHGEWARMFKGRPNAVARPVPFTVRTAQMFMKIAEHPILSDAKHVSRLPASWGTLYQLATLPEPILQAALTDGRVHPGMDRSHARALRPYVPPVHADGRAGTCTVIGPGPLQSYVTNGDGIWHPIEPIPPAPAPPVATSFANTLVSIQAMAHTIQSFTTEAHLREFAADAETATEIEAVFWEFYQVLNRAWTRTHGGERPCPDCPAAPAECVERVAVEAGA
jgi:hypothetical protein